MKLELSILIPALVERASKLPEELARQISAIQACPVELLVLTDNRQRSTGRKRQALLDLAQGRYITHLDDDDWVAPTYVADLLEAIKADDVDVIVFNQESRWNNENPFTVRCGLEFENEGMRKDAEGGQWQDIYRKPWHWCVFAARIAKTARFPDGYIDDDWFWLRQVLAQTKTQHRIDKILHFYRYNDQVSASHQGAPTT